MTTFSYRAAEAAQAERFTSLYVAAAPMPDPANPEENSIVRQMVERGLFNPPPISKTEAKIYQTAHRKMRRKRGH